MYVPEKMFFTKGAGTHREKLTSLEMALRAAGIARFNLVRVSSIFPPHCQIVEREEGLSHLKPGEIVHVVMSESATNEPSRLIAASIGLAVPTDPATYGYLSEHHSFGQDEATAGDYAEDLAATMLATTLGVDFDPEASWDERKELWRISGKMVESQNITQTATGVKNQWWTTVVAAAVLV